LTDSNKNIVEKYQFRDIFANAPISIWEEDFSAVGEWLACLRKRGIRDLNAFLKSEPQALRHALSLVRLVEVNNITLRLWEVRSKEELLDRWADLFADETYDVFTDELLAVWEGRNEITCQCSAKTATGRPIYYEMHWVAPMIDGKMNLGRVIVAIVDITDRKEKEEKLRQNEKNLQLAGQIAKIGHWSWDLISNEQTWSVETCRIFGIEAKMTTCKTPAFSDYIHPEDQKMVARAIQDAVEGIGSYDVEFRVLRLDGTVRWVHGKGEINFDKNRQPISMFGIIQDITERKKMQEELSRIHKLESIGIFAGGIAHDLNNILSGIITYPELLLMELPPDSPFITPITKIKRSGEHAAAMVQDLLTLARRGAVLAVPLNINKVIKDFLSSSEYKSLSASFSDIKVTTVFDETLPNIMGIPFHMLKVIMNLVINSAEAVAEHGEITITTNSYKLKKEIKGFEIIPAGEYVMLGISDNGAGIAPEHIKKIFEPFYTKKGSRPQKRHRSGYECCIQHGKRPRRLYRCQK